jgi:hypothetical protein
LRPFTQDIRHHNIVAAITDASAAAQKRRDNPHVFPEHAEPSFLQTIIGVTRTASNFSDRFHHRHR